jgi:agmatinase
VVQVGTRGPETSNADSARLAASGVTMLGMERIEKDGWEAVAGKVASAVRAGPGKVFVSFDMSVLDPAYAAGAGRPVPYGLTMREAVPLVRSVCASAQVVGFELLDTAPVLDVSYRSAQNANYILHACLTGMAQRKLGWGGDLPPAGKGRGPCNPVMGDGLLMGVDGDLKACGAGSSRELAPQAFDSKR